MRARFYLENSPARQARRIPDLVSSLQIDPDAGAVHASQHIVGTIQSAAIVACAMGTQLGNPGWIPVEQILRADEILGS